MVDTIKMTLELDDRLFEPWKLLEEWGAKTHTSLKQEQSLVGYSASPEVVSDRKDHSVPDY